MKLIDQSYEIMAWPEWLLDLIERAGRTCYKSKDRITEDSAYKFAHMIRNRGHESVFEHAAATVKFITNRGVTHELVRHRLASFSQESTRYVRYDGHMEFIRPVWVTLEFLEKVDAAGLDDVSLANMMTPALTTIKQPFKEMSRKAVEMVVRQKEENMVTEKRIVLEASLVIRETTAEVKEV